LKLKHGGSYPVVMSYEHLHCPHCDGTVFDLPTDETVTSPLSAVELLLEAAVTVTAEGINIHLLECLTCGADGLFPSDLIPS
jgi:hypothetical protein